MHDALLASVAQYAPAWVRYVLTLSEIANAGEGWVLAAGDDIAIMDAGGTSALPLWPYRSLAEGASVTDAEEGAAAPPPAPTGLSVSELTDKLLPALAENQVSVAVFPGPGENRLIGAEGVKRDLSAFVEEPRDIAAELATEPHTIELEGWANLNVPRSGHRRCRGGRSLLAACHRRRVERDRRRRQRASCNRTVRNERGCRGVRRGR